MRFQTSLICCISTLLSQNLVAAADGFIRPRDSDCSCGYYDSATDEVFTEAIITYFNETSVLSPDFITEDYKNKFEKDWNAIYRQGADTTNVQFSNGSQSLQLHVSNPDNEHLVLGGGVRTLRSDIQYGSFRSLLRPADSGNGGTSISMVLSYNDSQTIEINSMNTNDPSNAWISTLVGEEFPDRILGANFSTLSSNPSINVNPWDFTEYRVDWTKTKLNFSIGGFHSRSISKGSTSIPSVPCPVFLKHWSGGNPYSTQGPPKNGSTANVGWARLFFNSSLMNEEAHKDFDSKCQLANFCLTDDWTLRGSSPFAPEATKRWKQASPRTTQQWIAIWMAVACILCTTILLVHTLLPRAIARFGSQKRESQQSASTGSTNDSGYSSSTAATSGTSTPAPAYSVGHFSSNSSDNTLRPPPLNLFEFPTPPMTPSGSTLYSRQGTVFTPSPSKTSFNLGVTDRKLAFWQQGGSAYKTESTDTLVEAEMPSKHGSPFPDSKPGTPYVDSRTTTMTITGGGGTVLDNIDEMSNESPISGKKASNEIDSKKNGCDEKDKGVDVTVTQVPSDPPKDKQPLKPKQRVDYLAGLTAMLAIIVSVDHFCATFVPAVIFPGAPHHYESEVWANKIVTPYLLNQIWVGLFFSTSTRFLVSRYLRTGDLIWVGEKAVTRNFRVMSPIVACAMLEYFLMECGATKWLEYLPAITWSTWPYATSYKNFGAFVSECLELVYLVPNAVPQIIFNYCTGVLWTMPVQLQGSWQILLGVVIIREIKTPWKRFSYYTVCTILNWYASSWGSYFWLGLLLTDLDIVFKYKKHILSRPWLFYLLATFYALITIASLSVDVANQVSDYSFIDIEHRIHPDLLTGNPIYISNPTETASYYIPRLNGLLFAASLQALIELSPLIQAVFSCRALTWVFPHIFTIYLLHGLIFWSLGATICVFLHVLHWPYALNILLTATCCYAALVFSLPILTPLVELLGKNLTSGIWENARDVPPPRRATLFPYGKELLLDREENPQPILVGTTVAGDEYKESMDEKKRLQVKVEKLEV
ncbi:hypothetical protein B0J14DRAFT_551896 [Halenospora varia]|nr:hypothetical protein B0J14DRAFT_551896 [Halenospora varia]